LNSLSKQVCGRRLETFQNENKSDTRGRMLMIKFIDDLAGSIYDILKFIIRSISYFVAGMIIVAVPLYLIVWVTGLFR
jgi:hypothetical protein